MCVRAAEVLADRKWHDYEDLRKELMVLIPAGVAIRRNEDDRRRQHVKNDARTKRRTTRIPKRSVPISEERAILAGQRALAREFLAMRTFERRTKSGPTGPIKQVRMIRVPRRAIYAAEREERVASARATLAEATAAGDSPAHQEEGDDDA